MQAATPQLQASPSLAPTYGIQLLDELRRHVAKVTAGLKANDWSRALCSEQLELLKDVVREDPEYQGDPLGEIGNEQIGQYQARQYERVVSSKLLESRLALLEQLGYSFRRDPARPGFWLWAAPSAAPDQAFNEPSKAVDDAWNVVVAQAKALSGLEARDWGHLSEPERHSLVRKTLLGR